jgi:hypothetical protein
MPTIRQKQSTYAITILTFQRHRRFQRTVNAELFIAPLFQHRDKDRFLLHGFAGYPLHTISSHKRTFAQKCGPLLGKPSLQAWLSRTLP